MSMIKKYLKKDMYLQMKDRKLFIIYESYNGIIMVYQKIMNLLDKHQINRLIYDKKLGLNKWWITWSVQHWQSNWIKNFNGAYILVKGTITFLNTGTAEALDNRNKKQDPETRK